jgi:hypothetical protein
MESSEPIAVTWPGDANVPRLFFSEIRRSQMTDETEDVRRAMLATGQPQRDLEKAEQRWTTDQLREEFEVIGFMAPFVVVRRKSDGVKGSLEFTHNPRFYFNFVAD